MQEARRFFTYNFFHQQFLDLMHNLLTLMDALDVKGTPAILLGDGSNLKCGFGVKTNFMSYPTIAIGSFHLAWRWSVPWLAARRGTAPAPKPNQETFMCAACVVTVSQTFGIGNRI